MHGYLIIFTLFIIHLHDLLTALKNKENTKPFLLSALVCLTGTQKHGEPNSLNQQGKLNGINEHLFNTVVKSICSPSTAFIKIIQFIALSKFHKMFTSMQFKDM